MGGSVQVTLCPSIEIARGAERVGEPDLHGRQGRTVLAALLLERGRPIAREALAEQLWPSGPPRSWGDSLSAILSRLRAALKPVGLDTPDVLVAAKGTVQLRLPPGSRIDVEVAAEAVVAAEMALRDGDARSAVTNTAEAWSVLRHELVAADTSPLVHEHRARLGSLRLRALEARAAGHLAAGAWQAAIDEAERAVAEDPFRESVWRVLITAHLRAGSNAGALACWDRLRRILADELGADPSPESQALYLELLHQVPAAGASGLDDDLVEVVATAAARIGGPDEVGALRAVDDAYPRVREALRTAIVDGADVDAGLAMAVDLAPYWNVRGWWAEGRAWLTRALDVCAPGDPSRAPALRALGELAWRMGDLDAAEEALNAALTTTGDAASATAGSTAASATTTGAHIDAPARTTLAAVALARGDADRARALFEGVLHDAPEDDAAAGRCLLGLGVIAARAARFDDARAFFERALAAHRRRGDLRNVAMCLSNLASAVGSQGSVTEARAYQEEALAIRRALGDSAGVALSLINMGILLKSAGEAQRAIEPLEGSLALRRQIGDRAGVVGSLNALGDAIRATGDDHRALQLYREAIDLARAIPDLDRLCLTLLSAANVCVVLGHATDAAEMIDEAGTLADTLDSATLRAAALEAGAALAAATGDRPGAHVLLLEADRIRERVGAPLAPADRADIDRTRELISR